MNLGSWRRAAAARLEAAGVAEAAVKADWLACQVTGWRRPELELRGESPLSARQSTGLEAGLARLERHEPLQHVLGTADFFGRLFRCDPRALIPRPETEELAAMVIDALRARGGPADVADIGTGTGCLAITIALEVPSARVTAVDISPDALALARANAASLGAGAVRFRTGDLLDGFPPDSLDGVVANLPYVSDAEYETLGPDVRGFEPRLALTCPDEGRALMLRLLEQAARALRPGGSVWLEMGETQGDALAGAARRLGYSRVGVRTDLAGRPRFLYGDKP